MIILLSILFSSALAQQTNGFDSAVCGDCWCIHNPTGTNTSSTCPSVVPGIQTGSFPESTPVLYASFIHSNPLSLQTEDGGECYPFQDAVGPQPGYENSNNPQCERPASEGFCGYLFEDLTDTECSGRKYQTITYESEEEATEAGAHISHKGSCGICSSAQDFAARMRNFLTLGQSSVICGTRYFLTGSNWNELVECYSDLGFTSECSLLWAHFTATNAALCAALCLGQEAPFNEDPPQCALKECLECSAGTFQSDFDLISGRTLVGSGIVEEIARPCDNFYPVIHDPCPVITASPTITSRPTSTTAPTVSPTITTAPSIAPTASDASTVALAAVFNLGSIAIAISLLGGL